MGDRLAARFQVSGILKLQSRPGVFVCGEIAQGAVKAGMFIEWPIHGDAITAAVPIREVEFVDYSPGVAGVALGVRFEEDESGNEQLLHDFLEVGMLVNIWEPDSAGPAPETSSNSLFKGT